MQQAGQTAAGRATQPGHAQPRAPAVPLTADDAVRRALERNLDIQVQRLEPQLLDLQVAALWATYRPRLTSSLFTQGATNLPDQPAAGGSAAARSATTRCSGTPACTKNFRWGGGALRGELQQHPARDVGHGGHAKSGLYLEHPGPVHAAAAAELQDRPDADVLLISDAAIANHRSQPARDADDYRSPGPQCLLGPGVRDRQRRGGTPQPRSLLETGPGQSGQGRDRHHGADRRGAGPGRGSDPPSGSRQRRSHAPHQ